MSVLCTQSWWVNPGTGHRLWRRVWEPLVVEREMVILHGFGEHGGRYDALARRFASHRIRVICVDAWGHGRSGGVRGDIERFETYVDDLEAALTMGGLLQAQRVHLFGHSFGGLAAVFLSRRLPGRWATLTLQSPLFKLGFPVPHWKERLGRLAAKIAPWLVLSNEVDPRWLSHDPVVARDYRHDPLVHHGVSARAYVAIQQAADTALEQAASLTTPTLLLYGTGDHVVSPEACAAFAERLACEKRVVVFPEAYHELHHESAVEEAVGQAIDWMEHHA